MTAEDVASGVTPAPGNRPGSAPRAQAAVEVQTRLISLGESRVQRYGAGRGEIPVVIVHGAGDCVDSWLPVIRGVASFTEVVAFDRPGIGRSPAGPPATPEQYVSQLQDLLSRDSGRPVVLVGHSLGGLIAQLYARRHPDTVAGLVLVDATPESIADDSAAHVGFAMSGLLAAMLKATASVGLLRSLFHLGAVPLYPESPYYRSLVGRTDFRNWVDAAMRGIVHNTRAELRSVIPTSRFTLDQGDLAGSQPFGDLPLAVVSSRAYGKPWVTLQGKVATRSRRAVHRSTDDRFHNIHMIHPTLVIDTIREIHQEAQEKDAGNTVGG